MFKSTNAFFKIKYRKQKRFYGTIQYTSMIRISVCLRDLLNPVNFCRREKGFIAEDRLPNSVQLLRHKISAAIEEACLNSPALSCGRTSFSG